MNNKIIGLMIAVLKFRSLVEAMYRDWLRLIGGVQARVIKKR